MFAIPLYYCTDVTGPSILQPALYYKVVPQDKGENIRHHHKDMKNNPYKQIYFYMYFIWWGKILYVYLYPYEKRTKLSPPS